MPPQRLLVPATPDGFDEAGYLSANPDVAAAVASGVVRSARDHFDAFGLREGRQQRVAPDAGLRAAKLARLRACLSPDIEPAGDDGIIDTLTPALREAFRIVDTDNVSAHDYDDRARALIDRHAGGLVLDCGAGQRNSYYANVANYEIVAYDSTDVLGVAERLPFRDASFDAVLSLNVLEHVRDPFQAARELVRVLKPGGELMACVPFLQPLHGYPHHYYNMTHQGLLNLFDGMAEASVDVYGATRPMWALSWMLQGYARGLQPADRARFEALTVAELMRDPITWEADPIVMNLSREAHFELAAGCVLSARKPG